MKSLCAATRVTPVVLSTFACTLASCAVFAQSSELDAVVVTATRTAVKPSELVGDVLVIDRDAIAQSGGLSVSDILRQYGGVQIASNGGLGKESQVFVRGTEARHVLLLIDGMRYGSATRGAPNWDNLPLSAIERIEVLRGPAAALYGSDAVGGVVQIFTRRGVADSPQSYVDVTVGSYGRQELSAGINGGNQTATYALGVSTGRERGFSSTNAKVGGAFNPDRDGFSQESLYANARWQVSPSLELSMQWLVANGESQFDSSTSGSTNFDVRGLTTTRTSGAGLVQAWGGGGKTRLSFSHADDLTLSLYRTALARFDTERQQWSVQHDQPSAMGVVTVGFDHALEKIDSTRVYPVSDRRINGVFAGVQGRRDAHRWQVNARRDENSQFGSATTGSIGYGFEWRPSWLLTASVGSSFKAPTFNQLYWWPASGSYVGNPHLKPERGLNKELGLRRETGATNIGLVFFDNRVRDLIPSTENVNIGVAVIRGWNLTGQHTVGSWKLKGSLEVLDAWDRSSGSGGRKLPRRADEQLTFGVERAVDDWWLGMQVLLVSERFDNAANTRLLPGYGTVSLSAERQIAQNWTLQVRLNNAGDKVYETAYGYNQPGRSIYTSLNWRPKR